MLPHCGRCRLPQKNCVCGDLPSIDSPFEIIIVRHVKESRKVSNTAFIASLCIPSLQILDIRNCRGFEAVYSPQKRDVLLYPPTKEQDIVSSDEMPKRIYVLDGSWKQARKIYHKTPKIHSLPRLSLAPRAVPPPRILTPSSKDGMSTMEAISRCFDYFGFEDRGVQLHDALCSFIEQRRLVTGIRIPIPSGMSFSQVRKQGF